MAQISSAQTRSQGMSATWKRAWSILRQQVPLLVLILLFIFASVRYDGFLSDYNLTTFFSYNTIFVLLALGQTFVIMTGGIDISVGSQAALCAVVAARMSHYGLFPALIAVIVVGALTGAINGWAITRLRIPPFIVTLATQIGVRGLALIVSGNATISADSNNDFPNIYGNSFLGIPIPVWMLLAAFVLAVVVLNYTRFGRRVLAIGGNEEATRLMGMPVDRTKMLVYMINGMMAGLAGLLLASETFAGNPNEAVGWELNAIAAVIVGGTLLTGGKGSIFGSLVGALLLGLILNILNFENGYGWITLSSYWETVIRGAFLFIVVILQTRLSQQKKLRQSQALG